MARNDDHKYESYPKDSFDNPPTGPVGVHNGRRSWPVRLTPYAIVIVVAAAVGVLFWSAFSGGGCEHVQTWRSRDRGGIQQYNHDHLAVVDECQ